ncbi:MAG: hypothetical protein ACLP56_05405 [Candidatus Sulfotelmatobacter sp.]
MIRLPTYEGTWVDCERNLKALAIRFDSDIRKLEAQQSQVATGPNHPMLRDQKVKALEDELEPLRFRASAAHEGLFFHDPAKPSAGDREYQKWVGMAVHAGRVVYPDEFEPSIHAQAVKDAAPLVVVRGDRAGLRDLGAPTSR